jgi:hypothetical protein
MSPPLPQHPPDSRFGYFLVQTHVATGDEEPAVVRLTVEDLSSGQKLVFESVLEFSRFLRRVVEPAGDERWAPPADV